MSLNLYNISIRNKLIIAIQAVTITVLIVSFVSYFIFTSSRDQENLVQRMEITAKLVGEYAVSPIVFGDKLGGADILSRLSSMPEIVSAYIIDEGGSIFASYGVDSLMTISSDEKIITSIQSEHNFSIWSDDYFRINREIVFKDEYYGKIYLIVSLSPFKEKLKSDLKLLTLNMLLIFIISWLLSLFIQQYISKPINKLVRTTNKIVEDGDYTVRVHNQGRDEIGQLYTSYNKMLERIQLEQTQQKKYSKALEISENNYRSIFENSIVGIFNIDIRTGELLQANDRFFEILQLDPHKLGSYKLEQFLSKRDRINFLLKIRKEGQIENFEIEHAQGIWISFSGKHIKSQGYIDGVIQDITERKQNIIQLNKVNYELDNFVYHASHDLRSPLRSILGLTNLLKYNEPSDENTVIINRIEGAINRLDDLVTDLLTFSKNSRTDTTKEEIQFEQLIADCIESLPISLQEGIDIQKQINQKASYTGDKTRISVIINNLLVNACKYHKKAEVSKFIKIKANINDSSLQLTISDNGTGIATADQEKIFDMFYRASEASEGSGLGLYIVKNVVDTLNGHISLSSEEGKGTTFHIHLPNH